MKKFFIPLILCLFSTAMWARVKVGDLYYNLNKDSLTAEVTYNPNKYAGAIEIPDTIVVDETTYNITCIGSAAFNDCPELTSVVISEGVTSIKNHAFASCSKLTSVTIPSSVTSIGQSAFSRCYELNITVPNSVSSIGVYAFDKVFNVVYNGPATGAPWDAKSINGYVDGHLVYENESKATLLGCKPSVVGEVIIPNSVTKIGDNAFWECIGLTSISFPNKLTSIGEYAFLACKGLTSITIPDNVTSIGRYAFNYCSGLSSIKVEDGNTIYDSRKGCNAIIETATNTLILGCKNSIIPNSVNKIGECAFNGCKDLTSIIIPDSVTTIGGSAFRECIGLTSIIIPNGLKSIGEFAFNNCKGLTSITIPNSVTSIGRYAFSYCSGLTSITIPNSITEIELMTFTFCTGLTSITIPSSVTSIGQDAFTGCSGVTSITIPDSVKSIGQCAFHDVHNIVYNGSATGAPWCAKSLNGHIEGPFVYENESKTRVLVCNSAATDIVVPSSVTSVKESAFHDCSKLKSVVWNAKNCQDFNDDAFLNSSDITSFTFGDSVNNIPAFLCTYLRKLTNITIPNSVTNIGVHAFKECRGLTSVTIGKNVTNIGEYSFEGCYNISRFTCLAETPPTATFFNYYDATLYVLCNSLQSYRKDDAWSRFTRIECISAEEESSVGAFSVSPSVEEATFTWPSDTDAYAYELEITQNGEMFCTLKFNTNGHLIGAAFAPAQGDAKASSGNGFKFTVIGLCSASKYNYTFTAKTFLNSTIYNYNGTFQTKGYSGVYTPSVAESIRTEAGRVICSEDSRIYTLTGVDVTNDNGSLQGVYIVKTATSTQKVVVTK